MFEVSNFSGETEFKITNRALQRRGGVCDVYGGQDKAPAGASEGREARYVLIAGRSGGGWGSAPVTKSISPSKGMSRSDRE